MTVRAAARSVHSCGNEHDDGQPTMTIEPKAPRSSRPRVRGEGARVIPLRDRVASSQARTLIETSATIDTGRRREAEQAAAARLSQKALRDTTLAELLEDATFTLAHTLGIEEATVLLFGEDESDVLELVAGYGEIAGRAGHLSEPTVGSIGGLALTRREPIMCHASCDRHRFPGSAPLFEAGVESTLAVAIEGPDHAFGVLAAHSRGRREFTRADELFVQTVANVVGAAIMRDRAELALVEAEEAERRRIAEAVHDDTLQVMIAVALRLETLERKTADPDQQARLHELVVDTRGAATRLRSLAFDLFPEDLAAGLEVVLTRVLDDASQLCGFAVEMDVDLPHPPPKAASRTIYRNAQEAIVNIRKHAEAGNVRLELWRDGDGTSVRITDDGVGISPRAAAVGVRGHLGIKGLRDRTVRCGGRVYIGPGSERGTTVEFWVPDTPRQVRGDDAD
jgi:signal transduction histidine kinase